MGGFYQPQSYHPHFGFQPVMLFQSGTAYEAAKRAYSPSAQYVPRTTQGLPQRPAQSSAMPKAPASQAPVTSQKPVAPVTRVTVTKGNAKRCARKGCKHNASGRQTYCSDACKQAAYRERKAKSAAPKAGKAKRGK